MKRFILFIGLIIVIFGLESCSTDFDPNAEWTETTLVYGVLDQDDDTTFLRIQKCFLGSGNLLQFAKIGDSNYYAEGELSVKIIEWQTKTSGGAIVKDKKTGKELTFERTVLTNKPSGEFFSPDQPVYFAPSVGWYNEYNIYELEVKNLRSGNTVTAQTPLVRNGISLRKPTRNLSFTTTIEGLFFEEVVWTVAENARIYQPIIRFYYKEIDGTIETDKYLDIKSNIQRLTSLSATTMTALLSRESFGSSLVKGLNNGRSKSIETYADIFITAGGEDFSYYLEAISSSGSGVQQERPTYTNINNGIGIFTARRTKIKFSLPLDTRLQVYIAGLNIGF